MKLDKTKVYSLEDLTSEELNKVIEYVGFNPINPNNFNPKYLIHNNFFWVFYSKINESYTTTNAKELFYTLENIQVDCSELSEEQIKEMCEVYESNRYKQWTDKDALIKTEIYNYLRIDWTNEFYITGESDDKTTITYEKFMELFSDKNIEEVNINNIKVNCENLTNEGRSWVIEIFTKNGVSKLTSSDKFISSQNENLKEIKYEEFTKKFVPTMKDIRTVEEMFPNIKIVNNLQPKPKHYSKGIDTFVRMEANCTKEECLAFAKGNIDKYNWREKGQDLEDYKKIVSYANWAIKLLKDEK